LAGFALALAQTLGAALLARLHAPPGLGVALLGAPLLLVLASNTGWQTRVVTGDTALVVPADMAAMQWIREHTPADARFVINSFPAYAGTLAGRTDAGCG